MKTFEEIKNNTKLEILKTGIDGGSGNFLEDNCYRYKMQAKDWGIEV